MNVIVTRVMWAMDGIVWITMNVGVCFPLAPLTLHVAMFKAPIFVNVTLVFYPTLNGALAIRPVWTSMNVKSLLRVITTLSVLMYLAIIPVNV